MASIDSFRYTKGLLTDPDSMVVPPTEAARLLKVKALATLERWAADGRLESVEVVHNGAVTARGYTLRSIRGELQRAQDRVDQLKRLVTGNLAQGKLTSYTEAGQRIGLDIALSSDRKVLSRLLDHLSRESLDEHGVLLSVAVVKLVGGEAKGRPSSGFNPLAKELGIQGADEDDAAFFARHLAAVRAAYVGPLAA